VFPFVVRLTGRDLGFDGIKKRTANSLGERRLLFSKVLATIPVEPEGILNLNGV
jgi:hypothetical protein